VKGTEKATLTNIRFVSLYHKKSPDKARFHIQRIFHKSRKGNGYSFVRIYGIGKNQPSGHDVLPGLFLLVYSLHGIIWIMAGDTGI
jgi:hypothetical protein